MRLTGRRILVTGGASGIGLETARLFIAEGARVALLDCDAPGLDAAQAELGSGAAAGLLADVTEEAAVRDAVARATATLGGLDGLVNAAGVSLWRPFEETSYAEWQRIQAIDLDGPFLVGREAVPAIREAGGGTIVNLASGAGMRPLPDCAAYCTAKAGLVMLTRCMALDLVRHGIRVNAVAPGPIRTPMLERSLARAADPEAQMARYLSRVGMKRLGTAREIAQAVLFLSGAESSFTTGAVIEADGGRIYL